MLASYISSCMCIPHISQTIYIAMSIIIIHVLLLHIHCSFPYPLFVCLCRFTDAQHHDFLLKFMRSVAQCYRQQHRATAFVLDLLELEVPSLFVAETEGSTSTLYSGSSTAFVQEEFTSFLADYIQRNRLQDDLLKEVESIWVSHMYVHIFWPSCTEVRTYTPSGFCRMYIIIRPIDSCKSLYRYSTYMYVYTDL